MALLAGIFPVYPRGGVYRENLHCREYTIYFPGGAFDLRGYYGTNSFIVCILWRDLSIQVTVSVTQGNSCSVRIVCLSP